MTTKNRPRWAAPVRGEAEAVRSLLPLARRLALCFTRRHRRTNGEAYSDALLGCLRGTRTHDPRRSSLRTHAGNCAVFEMLDGARKDAGRRRKGVAGMKPLVSLDAPLDADGDEWLCDILEARGGSPEEAVDQEDVCEWLLLPLRPVARAVVRLTVLLGVSQSAVGEAVGLTASRVSQIRRDSLALLREVWGGRLANG